MSEALAPYSPAILACGIFGGLYLLQLLIVDVVAIRRRHVPGAPIATGHEDLLFRAARAHANTTESVGAFILVAAFAIGAQADARWVNILVWAFVGFRTLHMAAYYLDLRPLRSAAFALAVATLVALLGLGLAAFRLG
jgi:uncharacterized MAPEG superfamily protein